MLVMNKVKEGSTISLLSVSQVETRSAITWKYSSVVLESEESDHSKSTQAGYSRICCRGLVQVQSKAQNAKNTSTCDSRLIGDKAAANTYPYIQVKKTSARVELEASTSNTGEDQLFWLISAFCRYVFNNLSDEFGAEINELMSIKLEGSVG
ncbi:hypothetical protein Bca4012_026713 [Brassica carinata]